MGTLLTAVGIVFLAELGDKTQLVALGLGARHRLGPVLAGVALGYAATNLLSVVVGGLLGAALPTRAIGIGGGLLFVGFAGWTLRGHDDGSDGATGNPVLVWIGATIGITASGAVGVFIGRSMGNRLPERFTRIGSSVLFAVFGVVLIATNL